MSAARRMPRASCVDLGVSQEQHCLSAQFNVQFSFHQCTSRPRNPRGGGAARPNRQRPAFVRPKVSRPLYTVSELTRPSILQYQLPIVYIHSNRVFACNSDSRGREGSGFDVGNPHLWPIRAWSRPTRLRDSARSVRGSVP